MAEIEHFYDPTNKKHPKFNEVKDECIPLFSKECQNSLLDPITDMTVGEAVQRQIIDNEILAYFMVRSKKFFEKCGIPDNAIRYRQHLDSEMAHYASDCWDAEIETSYGWIEVAGHADRSCFDLMMHSKATKIDLVAARPLKTPVEVTNIIITMDKKTLGSQLKKDSSIVVKYIETATEEQKIKMISDWEAATEKFTIETPEKNFELEKGLFKFERQSKMMMEEKFCPNVIEPSFGIGRVIYCIFEHCFKVRPEDAKRTFFTFPPLIAPVKTSILPLISSNEKLAEVVRNLKKFLNQEGISSKVDDSSMTIGRRYARTDECGIPFAITVDFESLEDKAVTLRDLHSMKQVRIPISELPQVMISVANATLSWSDVLAKYPEQAAKEAEEEEKTAETTD